MWQVVNRTPYGAERNWVRDKNGGHQWIVAVKGTFDVSPSGELQVADEQPEPLFAAEYEGEDGQSSVRFDLDLGPLKPATDVWVAGHARPPGDKPVHELPISLRFVEVNKTLLVRGENVFHTGLGGLSTTRPRPFTSMPVVYERAFGGVDESASNPAHHRMYMANPVGVGFSLSASRLEQQPAPNVVYPGKDLAKSGPAGFGAIASHWSPRAELAGTYDAAWVEQRKPLLPADYDSRFTLCAPADQRSKAGHLPAGTRIELVNMTPNGVMSFELPRVRPTFCTHFGIRRKEHPCVVASVILLPDELKVQVVWQSSLDVGPKQLDYLDHTIVEEVTV